MITQESVKQWLKSNNRTRDWLADKCGTATQTVNNWLSTERGIPSKSVLLIQQLMAEDEERERIESKLPSGLTIHFTKEEFAIIQQAARESGQNTDTWAEDQLRLLCELSPQDVNSRLGYWQEDKPELKAAGVEQGSYNVKPKGYKTKLGANVPAESKKKKTKTG